MNATFVIPGEPMGKQRPRLGKCHIYTPTVTVNYETLVKMEYHNQVNRMLEGEIEAKIIAFYSIPKSASKRQRELMIAGLVRPTKKPDADNIAKIVLDSLNGIAYRDDSQIINLMVEKYYDETPSVAVWLWNKEMGEGLK